MWEDWQDMANSSLSAASGSKAGGSQLSEERRERSERASSYDPVFSLGRCAMSRPRDRGISADIPRSPPDNTLIHRFKRQGRASSARHPPADGSKTFWFWYYSAAIGVGAGWRKASSKAASFARASARWRSLTGPKPRMHPGWTRSGRPDHGSHGSGRTEAHPASSRSRRSAGAPSSARRCGRRGRAGVPRRRFSRGQHLRTPSASTAR